VIFLVGYAVIHPCQPAALFAVEAGDPLQHMEFTCRPDFALTLRVRALQKFDHFGFLSDGPDIAGVTKRRPDAWLTRWLKAPEKMLETDADAKAMLKDYNNIPMPNQGLSDKEVAQYLAYFHWIDAQPAAAQPAKAASAK